MPETIYSTIRNEASTPLAGPFNLPPVSNLNLPNTNGNAILVPKGNGIVDVRGDFVWSITPKKNVIDSIPAIYLIERSQETSSLVSSALYYITSLTGDGSTNITSNSTSTIITYVIEMINSSIGSSVAGGPTSNNLIASLKDKLRALLNNEQDLALLDVDTLKSYIGIYLTKKTGFSYVLPQFGNLGTNISNTWASDSQTSPYIAKTLITQAIGAVDRTADTFNMLQPGTFIEKPKYYQYPSEGESVTVTFPLLNTHRNYENVLPYQQNYELLWMLAYQNKPYRTSFSRIIPPKIYTLTIPGVKYMPYSYISNMNVEFQGTVRNLEVKLPTGQLINTPIPDAYSVSITFTGLLANIANMMASKDFGFKINTSFR